MAEPLRQDECDSRLAHIFGDPTLQRRIFDSVVNGVTISDATVPDMPLLYVNPAFERMTGYASEEVLGRNCRFLQRNQSSQTEVVAIREAISNGREIRTVLQNFTKQGALFWNELYLSPIFNTSGLLTHYVGIQHDISDRVTLERRIAHMALHDDLTGLPNRYLMIDRLTQCVSHARRYQHVCAVLFVDLDNFKEINDQHGHDAGDLVLKIVADRLKLAARESDCAARVGGDEFVLVAADLMEQAEAFHVQRRIRAEVEQPVSLGEETVVPRSSIGVGIFPADGLSPERLLKAADLSMYREKQKRKETCLNLP